MSVPFFDNPNADAFIERIPAFAGEAAKYPPLVLAEHYMGKHLKAAHMSKTAEMAAGD